MTVLSDIGITSSVYCKKSTKTYLDKNKEPMYKHNSLSLNLCFFLKSYKTVGHTFVGTINRCILHPFETYEIVLQLTGDLKHMSIASTFHSLVKEVHFIMV